MTVLYKISHHTNINTSDVLIREIVLGLRMNCWLGDRSENSVQSQPNLFQSVPVVQMHSAP